MTDPVDARTLNRSEIARRAGGFSIAFLWAHLPVLALVGILVGNFSVPAVVAAGVVAGVGTLQWRTDATGLSFQLAASSGLAIMVALFVFVLSGHPWQIDAHMYFFAAFALTAVFCDWRPVVAFATVTALHHLVLNFALPYAVFPDGADFGRVAVHAFIVVVQAVALVWLTTMIQQSFAASSAAITRAETATAEVQMRADREAEARDRQARVMAALSEGLGRLASGDLTAQIDNPASNPFPSDYEALRKDFNAVGGKLGESFSHVADSAAQVRQIAAEIGSFAAALSSRTEAQAATLEQSSAALSELSESVTSTARLAREGNIEIAATEQAAQANMVIVNESVEAIRLAEAESRKISHVIGVIDDIAFQTNLLALNAGVEAARAGESGRGFAVVASEVRSLAERASVSAREIRQMIVRSLDQVATGSTLAQRSGESLQSLVAAVQSMAGRVTEIASGAHEQARGLAEITSGISHLDGATQENATIAEESQAAAESLRMAADRLAETLSGFRMSDRIGQAAGKPPMPLGRGQPALRHTG